MGPATILGHCATACSFESEMEVCRATKGVKGRLPTGWLSAPRGGQVSSFGDFVQWRRGRGAGIEKGRQLVLVPLDPDPVLSSDTLLGRSHLWHYPKPLSLSLLPPLSGAGKEPARAALQGLPGLSAPGR